MRPGTHLGDLLHDPFHIGQGDHCADLALRQVLIFMQQPCLQ